MNWVRILHRQGRLSGLGTTTVEEGGLKNAGKGSTALYGRHCSYEKKSFSNIFEEKLFKFSYFMLGKKSVFSDIP